MRVVHFYILSLSISSLAWTQSLWADAFERRLFDSTGKQRHISELQTESFDPVWLRTHLKSSCPAQEDKLCIDWKLQLPDGIDQSSAVGQQIQNLVQSAFSFWGSIGGVTIEADFAGFVDSAAIPYVLDESENKELDSFNNPVVEPGLLVALGSELPVEFDHSAQLSQNFQYLVPDLETGTAKAAWSGLFLRPSVNPWLSCSNNCLAKFTNVSYSVRSVVIFEIGRILGLSAVGHVSSAMYPLKKSGASVSSPFSHEVGWLREIYGVNSSGSGSIQGRLISGETGEAISGAEVLLIPFEKRESFSQQSLWKDIHMTAISRETGTFNFKGLDPGEYILLSHMPLDFVTMRPAFGDWFDAQASLSYFSPNFYDGGGRESNQEMAYYSPQLIWIAAQLHVHDGDVTKEVQIISNESSSSSPVLMAEGANYETLSEYQLADVMSLIENELQSDQGKSSGCTLTGASQLSGPSTALSLIVFFLALIGFRCLRKRSGHP